MLMSPRPDSTALDLLRLLASWLAVALLVQTVGAALALGRAPLHRHAAAAARAAQAHHHAGFEHHHHDLADTGVAASGTLDDGDAAATLWAAMVLLALGRAPWAGGGGRHVWRAARAWAATAAVPVPRRRPPRPAA